jgi:perosamine synthetase
VAVHLFGLAAPMQEIKKVAERHSLFVIEDAACAIGTTYKGVPVGSLGDIGCFSFHPRKVVTTGEGGAVTTNDAKLADVVSSLRNHGATGVTNPPPEPHGPWTMSTFDRIGFNLRMSDIQASVGIAQIAKLDKLLTARAQCAGTYGELLGNSSDLILPISDAGHTYQSYVIRIREGGRSRRNFIMGELLKAGIQTRPGTHAVHRLGYYRDKYGLTADQFPNASQAEETTITLPIFPGMTRLEQEKVAATLHKAVGSQLVR